ncbi:hypothetical protein DFP72DRAFT_1143429, partial [Ephemerocybe angulata]
MCEACTYILSRARGPFCKAESRSIWCTDERRASPATSARTPQSVDKAHFGIRHIHWRCIRPRLVTNPAGNQSAQLESVFNRPIRRFLGLHARAFVAVLSSEMGILPLRYRRLLIALGFLLYLLRLPDHRYAKLALRDSIDLLASGKSGWFSDLLHSLQTLPIPVNVPDPLRIDVDMVEDIRERVRASMTAFIIQETNRISSLYLLKDRLEPGERRGDPPRVIPIKFRHYLSVITYRKDRVALTKILTGCHELAVERLKWARNADGEKVTFDRPQRLCRFCKHKAESPEHALLGCNACPDLVSVR